VMFLFRNCGSKRMERVLGPHLKRGNSGIFEGLLKLSSGRKTRNLPDLRFPDLVERLCNVYSISYSIYKNKSTLHVISGVRSSSQAVPVSKSRNIPEVVLVKRWAVGVLGIWRGGVGWVKGGANGVSLQTT
jgi:hypothetical protein